MMLSSMIEVVPELSGIEEMQLFLAVAKQLANTRVVEQQPAVLVDNVQPGRAVFENLAKLAFVLGNIVADRTVSRNEPPSGHIAIAPVSLRARKAASWRLN